MSCFAISPSTIWVRCIVAGFVHFEQLLGRCSGIEIEKARVHIPLFGTPYRNDRKNFGKANQYFPLRKASHPLQCHEYLAKISACCDKGRMSEHTAKLSWDRTGLAFGYKTYSRNHTWTFENGKIRTPALASSAIAPIRASSRKPRTPTAMGGLNRKDNTSRSLAPPSFRNNRKG